MKMNRRTFISLLAAGAAGSALRPSSVWAEPSQHLVILHTNDTHSRIDPFPMDGGRNQGLGGAARRARLIKEIRSRHPNVLLLDSGDIFQGPPYFNFFGGEIEFKVMSEMQYDVATLGNHDFDNGVEGLVKMLPHARFDFVAANYEISDAALARRVTPYVIKQFGPLKVGIFGLGIDFDGLVLERLHEGVAYVDPIEVARQTMAELRAQGCNLVVCLSHLGYRYRDGKVSDLVLAREAPGIDLILGGHTHTFLDEPDVVSHAEGKTIINQVGWGGIRLGRIDVPFTPAGQPEGFISTAYEVDHTYDLA